MKTLLISIIFLASSAWALNPNQKRLMLDKRSKQCFYTESVRKSAKFGWLNEKKAKEISRIKRKNVIAASSPVNVRKVFVPRSWCQGS